MIAIKRGLQSKAAPYLTLLRSGTSGSVLTSAIATQVLGGLATPTLVLGMGLAIDAAIARRPVTLSFALCLVGLVAQQVAAPLQVSTLATLATQVDGYVSMRTINAAAHVRDLATLEDPRVSTPLRQALDALDERALTPGEAAAGSVALVARYTQLAAATALLAWSTTPAVASGAAAIALLNRYGQTRGFGRWSAVVRQAATQRLALSNLAKAMTDPRTARDVRKLRISDWLSSRYEDAAHSYFTPLWSRRRELLGRKFIKYAMLSVCLGGLVVAYAASMSQAMTPGMFAITLQCVSLAILFGTVFPEADVRMQYGLSAWISLRDVEEVLDRERTPDTPLMSAGTNIPPRHKQDVAAPAAIAVEGAEFAYRNGVNVLRGVNLFIAPGSAVAVVGENGAGKSTLAKIILGFYEPQAGRLLIDNTELNGPNLPHWRQSVSVLHQDFLRHPFTVRENLVSQSVLSMDDDEVLFSVLEEVGLTKMVRHLSQQLDTPLSRFSQNGTDISGGEWQRLALARALYAVRTGSRLLVLDEPTSQMDARGEAEFYERFLDLKRGVSTLLISHRFSSVRQADRIFVLAGGVVIESGSHEELLDAQGHYSRMFMAQASQFAP